MTEYTARCVVQPADTIRIHRDTRGVKFWATQGDRWTTHVVPAVDARDFARGILALADEIDGGEAKPAEARTVKVGDKLRVTEDGLYDAEVFVGDVLAVKYVYDNGGTFYTEGDEWVFNARHIGNGLEFVDETPADEPALQVGDRVTIVREYASGRFGGDVNGTTGTVLALDPSDTDLPYQVVTEGRPSGVWVHEVRRADDTEPTTDAPSVADPRRLAALKEAQALLSYDAPDPDAVLLARFLLGE